jgi:predicted PurR-regulated permease PerM
MSWSFVLWLVCLGMALALLFMVLASILSDLGSTLKTWASGLFQEPVRRIDTLDLLRNHHNQVMNQMSQRRVDGVQQAQRVSDEYLKSVQEITGEQR